jgi:hypothetical protein
MKVDDSIIQKYLSGQEPASYSDCWVYSALGRGNVFETPKSSDREWVSQLCEKLKNQILNFIPRNIKLVKQLFPNFDDVEKEYTVMLVVGFPDPYDAMVLEYDGTEYMVFDLIQFGKEALNENYSCHRVLTHELIHACLHQKYPCNKNMSYVDDLNYAAFDEGFAHALSYPEDIFSFEFDEFLQEKYNAAKEKLKQAITETDPLKMEQYRISADTGDYWNKFASISGKLYLLQHLDNIFELYQSGWRDFSNKILG